ncbi:hypothetical protein PUN28_002660 [Cardiocondyla obscurior]|uniref:Uncharacterized protein n=1 Tax=Cardiocondyla obscurior TaxID=286306 RepID=A0AAW2GVE2_9HYME
MPTVTGCIPFKEENCVEGLSLEGTGCEKYFSERHLPRNDVYLLDKISNNAVGSIKDHARINTTSEFAVLPRVKTSNLNTYQLNSRRRGCAVRPLKIRELQIVSGNTGRYSNSTPVPVRVMINFLDSCISRLDICSRENYTMYHFDQLFARGPRETSIATAGGPRSNCLPSTGRCYKTLKIKGVKNTSLEESSLTDLTKVPSKLPIFICIHACAATVPLPSIGIYTLYSVREKKKKKKRERTRKSVAYIYADKTTSCLATARGARTYWLTIKLPLCAITNA